MTLRHIVSRLFTVLLAVVLVGVFTFDAEARRMGGGKSMGRQSSNVTQREATPPAAPVNPSQSAATTGAAGAGTAAAAGAAARKPWAGMLGGIAAGLGLAWLAHSLGLGPAFANFLLFLLLGVVIMAVIGMLRRARTGAQTGGAMAYQGAGAGAGASPAPARQYNPTKIGNDASARPWEAQPAQFDGSAAAAGGSIIGSGLRGSQSWGIPADFDIDGFTAAAKRNFITLQDAWDRSDISTLRSMMTDGMLTEIRSQLAERERSAPGQANKTDVQSLNAQLLGIEELDDVYMASVEFSGLMVEDPSAGPTPFREVWNMTKPRYGAGGWLVAGVQALQ